MRRLRVPTTVATVVVLVALAGGALVPSRADDETPLTPAEADAAMREVSEKYREEARKFSMARDEKGVTRTLGNMSAELQGVLDRLRAWRADNGADEGGKRAEVILTIQVVRFAASGNRVKEGMAVFERAEKDGLGPDVEPSVRLFLGRMLREIRHPRYVEFYDRIMKQVRVVYGPVAGADDTLRVELADGKPKIIMSWAST